MLYILQVLANKNLVFSQTYFYWEMNTFFSNNFMQETLVGHQIHKVCSESLTKILVDNLFVSYNVNVFTPPPFVGWTLTPVIRKSYRVVLHSSKYSKWSACTKSSESTNVIHIPLLLLMPKLRALLTPPFSL